MASADTPSGEPPSGDTDVLARAYEQRTAQLHEARGALAETVSALITELAERRAEIATLRVDVAALRDERDRAVQETGAQRGRAERAETGAHELSGRVSGLERELAAAREQLAALQSMTTVRVARLARRTLGGPGAPGR